MKVEVILRGRIVVAPAPGGEQVDPEDHAKCMEQVFEKVTDDLYSQGTVEPSVAGSMATGQIEVSVIVEGESRGVALDCGEAAIRAALHAADVATPGWDAERDSLLRAEILEVAAADTTLQPA